MQPQTLPDQYRVTFDVLAGIEPLTFPASTTADEITAQVVEAFEAAGVEIDVKVKVDLTDGVVTVANEDGDVFEHGSITRVEEQPKVEPGPRQDLAAALHRFADDIATSDLPLPSYRMSVRAALPSRADLERWAKHLGVVITTPPGGDIPVAETQIPLGGWRRDLLIAFQSPAEPQTSELERLREENKRLLAELAEGGDR